MKKTYLATAVAALFVTPITTAIAADTLLDDVVVSVGRSEQRSFDAPASVQAVNKETIQDAGPQVNITEVLNRVPGVVGLNRQNYSQDLQISIRGFGARTQFGVRGVRLIADGIPSTIPDGQGQASTISLTSAERIEVLRGPLAQLYGNAAGGVIQIFTREALVEPELLVQGYTGSYGLKRTDWQYAQKVGKFGLVVDYSTFKTDGYRQNSQAERNQFNGKLTYDHDEKTRISFMANVFDMPYAYDPQGLSSVSTALSAPKTTLSPASYRDRKEVKQSQVGALITHKIDADTELNLRVYDGNRKMLAYTGTTSNKWQDLDRDYYGIGLDVGSKLSVHEMLLNWRSGVNFDRSTEANLQGVATGGEKTSALPTTNKNQSAQNMDGFFQGNLFISERFSLLAGARATTVELHASSVQPTQASVGDLGSVTYRAINPVFGGTYYIFDNMNLFANYGRGFETPTLTEIGYTKILNNSNVYIPQVGFNNDLKASRSNHYEAGMKWIPNKSSRVDFSVFYIKTFDELVVDSNTATNSSYKNVPGGTTRKGWELSATNLITSSIKTVIAISQTDATFNTSFATGTTGTVTSVNAGNRIAGIPDGQLFAELSWSSSEFTRNKSRRIVGTILGLETYAAGSLYANDSNASDKRAPGYAIINAKASHSWELATVTLTAYGRVDNLANRNYIGSVIVGNASPFEPAPGRNWVLGLNAITRF